MIDFKNLQNASYPVNRAGDRRQYPLAKRETGYSVNFNSPASAGKTDVVEISADAALKGKLSTFSTALAKEMKAVTPERMALLKEKYAGDACPVSGLAVAQAIISRAKAEGAQYE
ncbi:MAG: hypothetical protein AAGU12_08480 [Clostridiales bacterium]